MTRRGLVTGLFLLAWGSAGMMAQPQKMAAVAHVEGQVLILRYGSTAPERAELGMTLFPGDQVKAVQGKCQLNFTAGGLLRLSPNTTLLLPTKVAEDPIKASVMLRKIGARWLSNARQVAGLEPDEVFRVRDPADVSDIWDPPSPDLVARRAKEDQERLAAERSRATARQPGGSGEDEIAAEYRSLLPAVLQAEKKPWHTRFEFVANTVKTGTGYRVAYKTYCRIDSGPDAGKDYACYEFDSVLDLGALKTAVADMKRRLGR